MMSLCEAGCIVNGSDCNVCMCVGASGAADTAHIIV